MPLGGLSTVAMTTTPLPLLDGRPPRVLVTYGWCRTAYVAARALARRGAEVFSCSSIPPAMCGWSRFSRDSARVPDPFGSPEGFVAGVAEIVNRWRIDVILPGHEDSIALRRNEDRFQGVAIACPRADQLELGVDKARVTRAAIELGIPTPRTCFPSTVNEALEVAEEIGFPLVVKLRRGNSGKGVVFASDPAALRAELEGPLRPFTTDELRFPIIQKHLPGQVVGACFLAQQGELVAVFGERYLRCKGGRFGTSVFREPLMWPRLTDHVAALVRGLGWTGLGHVDFIEDADRGEAYLLELNPRLWGALNLSLINGFDFPSAAVAQALGEGNLSSFFPSSSGPRLRSIWLIGEMIGLVNRLGEGEVLAPFRVAHDLLRSLPGSRFDDLSWRDPAPFIAEALCYARLYLKSGGDTNPASEGMFG